MVSLPPWGMASRALTTRFMEDLLELRGVGLHPPAALGARTVVSSTSSPINRPQHLAHVGDHGVEIENLGRADQLACD